MKHMIMKLIFFILFSIFLYSESMVLVKGSSFEMGIDREIDGPVHRVKVDSFYISKYETTMEEFAIFFREVKPNGVEDIHLWRPPLANLDLNYYFKIVKKQEVPNNLPMIGITWYEAISFCNWKSEQEGLTPAYVIKSEADVEWVRESNGYRLPTEAEWEYAARGGENSKGFLYAGSNNPDEVSWYKENSDGMVHPVGLLKPNELELYDFSGNVAEWCWDYFDYTYFLNSSLDNPIGPSIGKPLEDDDENSISSRVSRGGTYWG